MYLGSDWYNYSTYYNQTARFENFNRYLPQSPYMDLLTQLGNGPAVVGDDLIDAAIAAEDTFHQTSLGPLVHATDRRLADLRLLRVAAEDPPGRGEGDAADDVLRVVVRVAVEVEAADEVMLRIEVGVQAAEEEELIDRAPPAPVVRGRRPNRR